MAFFRYLRVVFFLQCSQWIKTRVLAQYGREANGRWLKNGRRGRSCGWGRVRGLKLHHSVQFLRGIAQKRLEVADEAVDVPEKNNIFFSYFQEDYNHFSQ